MTATRTLAKSEVFSLKNVREGKKVENATRSTGRRKARFLRTQRRGPFRICAGFPVARVLRPAARVLKKPTFAGPNPKNETRLASAFAVEKESTGGRRATLERARANVDFIIALLRILSTGGTGRAASERERSAVAAEGTEGAALIEKRALIEARFLRRAAREAFEFRGKFVLFDFVVHRFFANAEFARGETTATVASDERFEESESFYFRQRQSERRRRRRRRKVDASGRARRSGERTRRFDGGRKRNVGDRDARVVAGRVAGKSVNDASRRARNDGGAASGERVVGTVGRERVAAKRRFGGGGVTTGKTVEGVHRNRRRGRREVAFLGEGKTNKVQNET